MGQQAARTTTAGSAALKGLHGYERLMAALRHGDADAAEGEMRRRIVRESCREVIGRMQLRGACR